MRFEFDASYGNFSTGPQGIVPGRFVGGEAFDLQSEKSLQATTLGCIAYADSVDAEKWHLLPEKKALGSIRGP
jgi:hypothetical protein